MNTLTALALAARLSTQLETVRATVQDAMTGAQIPLPTIQKFKLFGKELDWHMGFFVVRK